MRVSCALAEESRRVTYIKIGSLSWWFAWIACLRMLYVPVGAPQQRRHTVSSGLQCSQRVYLATAHFITFVPVLREPVIIHLALSRTIQPVVSRYKNLLPFHKRRAFMSSGPRRTAPVKVYT